MKRITFNKFANMKVNEQRELLHNLDVAFSGCETITTATTNPETPPTTEPETPPTTEPETPGGDNTDKVTVNFHFENGGTETREYPKGTILRPGGTNYPANTPGYNWSILNVTLNSDTNAWEVSEGDSGLD